MEIRSRAQRDVQRKRSTHRLPNNTLERHVRYAGKWGNMREHCRVNGYGFVDTGHDIVTVSAIIDAGDPRWIRRVGKGDRGEQYQRRNDRKRCRDRSPHGTRWLSRWP